MSIGCAVCGTGDGPWVVMRPARDHSREHTYTLCRTCVDDVLAALSGAMPLTTGVLAALMSVRLARVLAVLGSDGSVVCGQSEAHLRLLELALDAMRRRLEAWERHAERKEPSGGKEEPS